MNKDQQPRQGDIYMIDWTPGRGSEQLGQRPGVIVQTDAFNSNARYPNTIVVAVSKSGRAVPTHVEVLQSPENGLWEPVSYVKCEQIMTIAKERLLRRLGRLTDVELAKVILGLKRVMRL